MLWGGSKEATTWARITVKECVSRYLRAALTAVCERMRGNSIEDGENETGGITIEMILNDAGWLSTQAIFRLVGVRHDVMFALNTQSISLWPDWLSWRHFQSIINWSRTENVAVIFAFLDCSCAWRNMPRSLTNSGGELSATSCSETDARKYSELYILRSESYRRATCFECKRNKKMLIKYDNVMRRVKYSQYALYFGLRMYALVWITRYMILCTARANIFFLLKEMLAFSK